MVKERKQALERVISDLADQEFSARVARDSNTNADRVEALERAVRQENEMIDLARARLAEMGGDDEQS